MSSFPLPVGANLQPGYWHGSLDPIGQKHPDIRAKKDILGKLILM